MIQHLTGSVIWAETKYFVLDVAGVGYKVYGTSESCAKAYKSLNDKMAVWIHMVVREDAMDLYGFLTREDLEFFELLITVSGIGPKSALGVMGISPVDSLKAAIASSDTTHLVKVSGIGKKLAEKIVLELKDKVTAGTEAGQNILRDDVEVLEALKAIGYGHNEARDMLQLIPPTVTGTKDRIKHALKIVGR
ncbi:MAG: Holliday junction branch migration protein RuvA [bacterium]